MSERRKILVTGGAGFIGSHTADRLIEKGYDIAVVDDLSSGYIKNINPKAVFYKTDITDIKQLKKIFGKEMPSEVIHAAAQIKVLDSISNPIYDAKVNILGGLNVLECCKKFKTKKIVYLSTGGALYGNPEYVPVDEDHPINPISPYGVSKYTLERYLYYYFKNFCIDYISLRFSNVYGPRDEANSNHVIPLFVHNLLNKKSPYITGDGSQGRDFIYVRDVVNAIIRSLKKKTKDNVLNIGTEKIISINSLYDEIRGMMKLRIKPKYVKERPGEVRQIYLSAKRAEDQLGWKPNTGLRKGLKETIKWFKEK